MTPQETLPLPEPYVRPEAPAPAGSLLSRGLQALVLERRLPYQLQRFVDRFMVRVGMQHKTIRFGNATLKTRRCTFDESMANHVLVDQDYNAAGYEIRENDVVVDVGGQIGSFAIYAGQRASQGRVYSFEPMRENYDLLVQNIKRNRLTHVTPVSTAVVGGKSRTLKLYITDFTGGHSITEAYADSLARFDEVPATSLEDVFTERQIERCDFLKLDCEGAEFDILLNTPNEILSRVERVAMEWHASTQETKLEESQQLIRRLMGLGFAIDKYVDFTKFRCGFIFARQKRNDR